MRAYRIAMTPPREPVVIVIDSQLQEAPIAKDATFHIPKLTLDAPPAGDYGTVEAVAKLLVAAENPVVVAGTRCAFGSRNAALHRICRSASGTGDRSGR